MTMRLEVVPPLSPATAWIEVLAAVAGAPVDSIDRYPPKVTYSGTRLRLRVRPAEPQLIPTWAGTLARPAVAPRMPRSAPSPDSCELLSYPCITAARRAFSSSLVCYLA